MTSDNWSSEAYQHSASFVPKLATKILQWLDPQPDDVVLDIGCGDGVLSFQIGSILAHGTGNLYGIDNSTAMVSAAQSKAKESTTTPTAAGEKCTFSVLDATQLIYHHHPQQLPQNQFTKAFSNAAMHWILRPQESREDFFRGVREILVPGGKFAFEMGGLGNVAEVRAAVYAAVGRRIGLERVQEVDPWFFPDEAWAKTIMKETVGGWEIEKVEREWRPTPTDAGGINGWVRLMAKQFFQALPDDDEVDRDACIKEVVDVLERVCAQPGGGYMLSYVRLRVLARKL